MNSKTLTIYTIDAETYAIFDELASEVRDEVNAGNVSLETRDALIRFLSVMPLFKVGPATTPTWVDNPTGGDAA